MVWNKREENKEYYNIVEENLKDKKLAHLISTMKMDIGFVNDLVHLFKTPMIKYDINNVTSSLKDLNEASDLLIEYINSNKNILVITDYDSDGVNAAAMAYKYFKDVIKEFNNYSVMVNKPEYGYGINDTLVDMIKEKYNEQKVDLIITMDHGITNEDMYKKIKEACPNIKIIVTDHHEIQEDLYPTSADFVIDNKRKDNPSFIEASGCLIGFYLLCNTYCKLTNKQYHLQTVYQYDDPFNDLLPHLGISLLSDVIPINNMYNRLILVSALNVINNYISYYTCWDTFKKLFKFPYDKIITEDDLIFKLSPMLNLGKRCGQPHEVMKLLTTTRVNESIDLVNSLNIFNNNRKNTTEKVYRVVKENLSDGYKFSKVALISCEYNIGGSIASKLTEDYNGVPSICFNGNLDDETLIGSGRLSIPNIDFMKILEDIESLGKEAGIDIFVKHGGHKEAVGITIKTDSLDSFKKFLDLATSKYIKEEDLTTVKEYNMDIDTSEIKDYGYLVKMLSPYGKNYNKPIFKSRLEVVNVKKYNTYAILDFKLGDETISGFYPTKTLADKLRLNRFTRMPDNDLYGYEADIMFTISSYSMNVDGKEELKRYSLSILDIN